MIRLLRKLYDRKFSKPDMYISSTKMLADGFQVSIIIHGDELKEYRILVSDKYHSDITQLFYINLISIILNEDVYKVYYDSYNNYGIAEYLKNFGFIRLVPLHGSHELHILKDLESNINEDNIIKINIRKENRL